MRFLGAVYASFITAGAGLGPDTTAMNARYREILTNPSFKATPRTPPQFASGPLEVNVIFTDLAATAAALKIAQLLAGELGARIRVRAAVAVPFQFPVGRPHISVDFLQDVLRKLVSHADLDPFDPTVHLYFCRDRLQTLLQVLKPDSLVLIGGRKHWWPTKEHRVAREISSKGHQVVFVDSKPRSAPKARILPRPIFAR